MKCNQFRPGFELVSPCPIPATITITPRAPPIMLMLLIVVFYRSTNVQKSEKLHWLEKQRATIRKKDHSKSRYKKDEADIQNAMHMTELLKNPFIYYEKDLINMLPSQLGL